ncbi:MAG: maltose alpha-D-glucosyltransferase, partial [Chloroflexia bacterium]
FMEEAHKRGLKVLADLVLNHTSDKHAWFKADQLNPDRATNGYYVWTDDPNKYAGTRIIFTDTEPSNWTWDNTAKQYYWHRFFSHQPDLNFDNPIVRDEMINVMNFWLDTGLDGFRCDAVPYLFEREGTNCENLPETHQYLKRVRKAMDDKYGDKILLAEANQWPEDLLPYFGNGDEFHMSFNFPLMPRMFMAISREERKPIIQIIERLPAIPEGCQWGIFLRNHDELTLEMVTDEERKYMYGEYAKDARMKINVGIRRRLAPLLDNGRRQTELLNGMLFSLPGTPCLYYGDEIGMGDNIYLGDRDGVRTPMQWTGDRNASFSHIDPARLYSPTIQDPVYGYQAVNVEAQSRTQTSLLNWMKRMIKVRKENPVFGRGDTTFLHPSNQKVLAYIRSYKGTNILCVNNLSRFVQPCELDLSAYNGSTPVELLGNTPFPRIGDLPYFLTLGPHDFYWFRLEA